MNSFNTFLLPQPAQVQSLQAQPLLTKNFLIRPKASSWFDREAPKTRPVSNNISIPSSEQSTFNLPPRSKGDSVVTFQGERHPEYLTNSPSCKLLTHINNTENNNNVDNTEQSQLGEFSD